MIDADLRSVAASYKQNIRDSIHLTGVTDRDFQVDAMKGIAIILVVLGHAIQTYLPESASLIWYRVIYSFHMPLFFFISGYLARASVQRNTRGELLWKRFKNLIIPYLTWTITFGVADSYFNWKVGPGAYAWSIIKNPGIGLWFLYALFLCFLLLVVAVAIEKYLKVFAYLLVLLVIGLLPTVLRVKTQVTFLGLALLQLYLLFFFAGYLVAQYEKGIKELMHEYRLVGNLLKVIAVTAFPVLVGLALFSSRAASRIFNIYSATQPDTFNVSRLSILIVAFLGIAMVFCGFKMKKSRRGIGGLAWLGYYSLDIYVIHIAGNYFLLWHMATALWTGSTVGRFFAVIAMTISAILYSLCISIFVLRQNAVLELLFLGKTRAKKAKSHEKEREAPHPSSRSSTTPSGQRPS